MMSKRVKERPKRKFEEVKEEEDDATKNKNQELHDKYRAILSVLKSSDAQGIFAHPVNPDEIPGYKEAIQEPMDFSTIEDRIAKLKYPSSKDFESDINLVFSNAMVFNPEDSKYYQEAERLAMMVSDLFKTHGLKTVEFTAVSQKKADYEGTIARADRKLTKEKVSKELSDLEKQAEMSLDDVLALYKSRTVADDDDDEGDDEEGDNDEGSDAPAEDESGSEDDSD